MKNFIVVATLTLVLLMCSFFVKASGPAPSGKAQYATVTVFFKALGAKTTITAIVEGKVTQAKIDGLFSDNGNDQLEIFGAVHKELATLSEAGYVLVSTTQIGGDRQAMLTYTLVKQ